MQIYEHTTPNAITEVTFSGMEDLVPENSPYRDFYEKGYLHPYKDREITVSHLTYHQKKSDFCHPRMLYHGALCLSPWLKEHHPAFFQRILDAGELHRTFPSAEGDFVLVRFPLLENAICPSACRLGFDQILQGFSTDHIAFKAEAIPPFGVFNYYDPTSMIRHDHLYIVDTGTEDSFYHYITTHKLTGISCMPLDKKQILVSTTYEILPLGHPDPRPVVFIPSPNTST